MLDDIRSKAKELGYLDRTPIRGTVEIISVVIMYILFTLIVVNWKDSYIPFLLGLGMTVMFSRAIFIIHDILHTQYYKSKKLAKYISYFFVIIVSSSPSWWAKNHHMHHHPWANIIGKDSDITILNNIFVSRIPNKGYGIFYFLAFWLGMFIVYPYFIVQSYLTVIKKKKYFELLMMLLHIILIWLPIFYYMSLVDAIIVFITLFSLLSLWMGLGFSMNHFGCETFTVKESESMDVMSLRMRTTRSLKPGIFTQWFYGGLNAHIEHHLFPSASRFKMLELQKFVKEYSKKYNLEYHEDTILESYRQINKILKRIDNS